MTKEERAEKWFEKIPESESISMEKKMEICHKAAIGIVVIFFVLCIVERILLYSLTDGEVLNRMADILNKMSEGSHTRNHYRGMAVVGGLMVLPFMIIPTLGALMFKKQYIKYQVETMKDNMTRADVHHSHLINGERMKAFNCSDWTLDIGGTEQDGFTEKELEQQLTSIKTGETDFIILTPPEPIRIQTAGCLCNFVQVCSDKDSNYFHLQVGTVSEKRNNDILIYGKDRLTEDETMTIFRKITGDSTSLDVNEWEVVLDLRNKYDVESYRKMVVLLTDNTEVRSKLESCLESPQRYYRENVESYEERCIDGNQEDDRIVWFAIADEMILSGAAIELDWKTDVEDFFDEMKGLANRHHLGLQEDWFQEDDDIPTWCELLDEKWADKQFCVGAMDIDSDSYVLFVCRTEVLKQLSELGKQVGQRFDFAKNM
ncbi:DUF6630 family protein [Filifactor alocis]|uniref:DUF6630 family protein n=1 Tax=Filifactor alocis TaxID=143361 RepID=UPI003C704814